MRAKKLDSGSGAFVRRGTVASAASQHSHTDCSGAQGASAWAPGKWHPTALETGALVTVRECSGELGADALADPQQLRLAAWAEPATVLSGRSQSPHPDGGRISRRLVKKANDGKEKGCMAMDCYRSRDPMVRGITEKSQVQANRRPFRVGGE